MLQSLSFRCNLYKQIKNERKDIILRTPYTMLADVLKVISSLFSSQQLKCALNCSLLTAIIIQCIQIFTLSADLFSVQYKHTSIKTWQKILSKHLSATLHSELHFNFSYIQTCKEFLILLDEVDSNDLFFSSLKNQCW